MESSRFDRLAKLVSCATSRRAALRTIGLGLAGPGFLGAGVGLGQGHSATAKKGKKRTICHCGSADPQSCTTITKKKKAAKRHLRKHCDYKGSCRDDVVNPCEPGNQCLPITELEGRAEQAGSGAVILTTENTPPFSAAALGFPSGTKFGDISSIATSFNFTTGDCGAGTPRFCITFEGRDDCACAQIPTDLCDEPSEAQGNSGNLIGNNTPLVWFRLCADGPTINSYNDALSQYAGEVIESIFVVADESNGEQTVTLEPCITLV